jgi:imidazolonepropionase-like amidohydrolase
MHVRGVGLPDEAAIELWVVDGRISHEPVAGADTVFDDGWILPGLVDAHCHVGLGDQGEIPLDEAIAQAEAERDVGALLLRDCGSPTDTRSLDDHDDLPTWPGPSVIRRASPSSSKTNPSCPRRSPSRPAAATAG